MSLAARLDPKTQLVDLRREGGNLLTDEGLEAAVLISIFTHRRAGRDLLPAGTTDLQGWWGDAFAPVPGDRVGSLLWLLNRRQLTDAAAIEARGWIQDCLAWMVADGVTTEVHVDTARRGDIFAFSVEIPRPADPTAKWRRTWEMRIDGI